MSEKRKWFDSAAKYQDLVPTLVSSSAVSAVQAKKALAAAKQLYERRRISRFALNHLSRLCTMPPARRLACNLVAVLHLIGKSPIGDIMREGLTESERWLLLDLEHVGASSETRAIAQGLLNISERKQMISAVGAMFHEERSRRWEVTE